MPDFIKRAALLIILAVAVVVLIFSDYGIEDERVVRYDCRDAHWLPDIPVEVKRECQRIMYERWKQEQEEKRLRNSV